MGVYKVFLREVNRKSGMSEKTGYSENYRKYGIILGLLGFIFLLLVISAYAHGTWGHTSHRVFLEEWKNTEQAKFYAGGSNHPYIGYWDKDNRYGGYIDGKKEWKWDWGSSGYYVPTGFAAYVHFEPSPYHNSIRSEDTDNGRAPKGGLVIGSIGVHIGKWGASIPTFDYIDYHYDGSKLSAKWKDYRSPSAALLNDDFAFWQAMYPYGSAYNHDQKVEIDMVTFRTASPGNGSDYSSAHFVIGDNTGHDDGYIDPVWKN